MKAWKFTDWGDKFPVDVPLSQARAEDFDALLLPGGVIVFANNFRRFKLDESALSHFSIKEISAATIPFDFTRNQRIHRAWELRQG